MLDEETKKAIPDERDQIGEPPKIGRLSANALAVCIEHLEARIERLERYTHVDMKETMDELYAGIHGNAP